MKRLIVLIFITTVFFSCNNETTQQSDKNNAPIVVEFHEETFKGNEQIYEEDSLYSEMTFRYPVFSGGDGKVIEKINSYVESLLHEDAGFGSGTLEGKKAFKTLKEIATRYFQEAKESELEGYPYTSAWSYNLDIDTLMVNPKSKHLTIIHSYNTYTGGAHPNHFTQISNIDLQTGDTLSYNGLFGNNQPLLAATKKRFIENEKKVMKEYDREFSMNDYWFEGSFILPQAMGITREGIRCIYSPYEVAPYARGPIEFTVPFTDIPEFKVKQ